MGVEQQAKTAVPVTTQGEPTLIDHGSVVIAAITSCTNTSNPAVMVGAGLLARNAVERGLRSQPWVKTSLAPGSKVVTDYLERVRSHGTARGSSASTWSATAARPASGTPGPLPEEISAAIEQGDLAVASVLSGNRNFEGRIHSEVKMNYLASPPLVVAYALAGRMDVDLTTEPLGEGSDGEPVYLRDIWPTQREIHDTIENAVQSEMFPRSYADVYAGDERWNSLEVPTGDIYDWPQSTYVKRPPFFEGMPVEPRAGRADHGRARAGAARRQRDHRPHLSRRRDPPRQPRRAST